MEENNENNMLELESKIVKVLKNIYDPEIPVNIYDLGLIFDILINGTKVEIIMTLTAPNCPVADQILLEVKESIESLEEVEETTVTLTFDPPWDKDMMSEEALLELGMM